jgi:drug/metabolite transporter (DMT)-like permease
VAYSVAVPEFLRIATAVVGLALAAWAGYLAWRDRPPRRGVMIGTGVLGLFAIALAITALVRVADGHRPASMVTFIGYVVAFLIIPPAGYLLARLEPTKWGSVIIAVVGLVEAIRVVRLGQVFAGTG